MQLVRSRALTDETLGTRRALLLTSILLVLVLIMRVDVSEIAVLGVKVAFGKAQLLISLMAANIYLTFLYSARSLRDQNEQAQIYDIASHDELVGKPVIERLESALDGIQQSKRLSKEGKQQLIDAFIVLALSLATAPSDTDNSEDARNRDAVRANTANIIHTILYEHLRPVEPELAGKLMTHKFRMQRRDIIYMGARAESFLRAEGFSSITHLLPTVASTVLTGLTAYALYDPGLIEFFQNWISEVDAMTKAATPPVSQGGSSGN